MGGYGTEMAWEDDAAGDWDIVVRNGIREVVLPVGTSNQRHPALSRGRVFYEDDRAGNWDIYSYDLAAAFGTPPVYAADGETAVAAGSGDQRDPAVHGDWVVYEDNSRGNWDIAARNLRTGAVRFLTSHRAAQVDPDIDGNTVVFADRRNGDWDIYSYDLAKNRVRRLTASKAHQTAPSVGQGTVVYQDRRHGHWEVYSLTLSSGKEQRLTSGSSNKTAPQIARVAYNNRTRLVVYEDDRRGSTDIYVRDGRTGISKPVTREAGDQRSPVIHQETIAWRDERSGQPDVYGCALEFPTLTFSARSATCGYNAAARFTGSLQLPVGLAEGQVVRVAGFGPTRTAKVVADTETRGHYSIALRNVVRKITVRAWYPGDADHLPAWGGRATVKPQAKLSRPRVTRLSTTEAGSSLARLTDRCVVSGTLRPRHRAGSSAVTLLILQYHLVYGWQVERKVKVKVSNASGGSAYKVTLRIPNTILPKRAVQAVHEDADHARTVSALGQP
jgi:beta propeller repeat protein